MGSYEFEMYMWASESAERGREGVRYRTYAWVYGCKDCPSTVAEPCSSVALTFVRVVTPAASFIQITRDSAKPGQ